MTNKTILVAGNAIVKEDSYALGLIPALSKSFPEIKFIGFDPTEELPENIGKELIIIDTVYGIDNVTLFNDLNGFQTSPRITPHDFDLPINLGILMKLGKIDNVTIIAVPQKGKRELKLREVINQINKL